MTQSNPAAVTPTAAPVQNPAARSSRSDALLRSIGLGPVVKQTVLEIVASNLPASGGRALDAGCGTQSYLARFRPRLVELVGLDVHKPAKLPRKVDRFVRADVCTDADVLPADHFDLVLSSFTVEHLADPPAAFHNIYRWLRPGGTLVLSTVNRDHPLVGAYLALSPAVRSRLQRVVKRSAADAHPVVGAANRPAELRAALEQAGFRDVELVMTPYLARAWSRRAVTFLLGLLGDLMAHRFPSRRSTIIASARKPATSSPHTSAIALELPLA